MGRRDPGAADQVTRLSGCSLTRAAGAGSFDKFSASFRDKLREKLARPDAAVPLREAGSLPNFSARRLLSRATAAAALRALRRARFFRRAAAWWMLIEGPIFPCYVMLGEVLNYF